MSQAPGSSIELVEHDQRREENLEKLFALRDDLKIIAESDAEYRKYAKNALETLREEGYDV